MSKTWRVRLADRRSLAGKPCSLFFKSAFGTNDMEVSEAMRSLADAVFRVIASQLLASMLSNSWARFDDGAWQELMLQAKCSSAKSSITSSPERHSAKTPSNQCSISLHSR